MSIYPVRLNEWFPKGDQFYEAAKITVKYSKCIRCGKNGKKINYKLCWAHHSLPWGNGEVWCTTRCFKKWANG